MVSFFITKRYLFSKSERSAINIISYITSFVITIGTASLIVVLAGFAGLQGFTVNFINHFDPDLKVFPSEGKIIVCSVQQASDISKIEGVVAFSKTLEERVFLNFKNKNDVAQIKGVDKDYIRVNRIDTLTPIGNWDVDKYRVVMNHTIAQKLGIGIYDQNNFLKMIVPKYSSEINSPMDIPYREIYTVVSGIYQSNYELGNNYIFSDIAIAQKLLNKQPNEVSGIEIKLSEYANEDEVKISLNKIFNNEISIKNRTEQNSTIFKMLNTEKAILFAIFIIVLLIAFFNLSGFLLMKILDKRKDIKTLAVLGLNVNLLRRIFFLKGLIISISAAFVGILIGSGFVFMQHWLGFLMISPTTAYPMELKLSDHILVLITIISIGGIISLVVAKRINTSFVYGSRK